ncbi:hypothetical protein [Rhodospirillum centenum]|uniref:Membrane protein, putative n=1 Tax=Rhodospirillum centenum (strain ATCC 51521 / SW) TaxID=414684 RepID=B6IY18_RHOCS|nr:hypothetical protein [Rhodospirillum centenum]ACJ01192.1 membrane protein, putative [Rhodospirillum centenum SW]
MQDLLTLTYAVGGIAAAFFHVPQWLRLWRTPALVAGISPWSWLGWFGISLNSLAYALAVNHDRALIAMSVLTIVCQAVMLGLMARAHAKLRTAQRAATDSPAAPLGAAMP